MLEKVRLEKGQALEKVRLGKIGLEKVRAWKRIGLK